MITADELLAASRPWTWTGQGGHKAAVPILRRAAILKELERCGGARFAEMNRSLGIPKKSLIRTLQSMLADGEIRHDGQQYLLP